MVEWLNAIVDGMSTLFPGERELLEEVCKLIDAEIDAHTAWQMISNLDETWTDRSSRDESAQLIQKCLNCGKTFCLQQFKSGCD
jgi:hypothetical protein